jgi:hypothetical protein
MIDWLYRWPEPLLLAASAGIMALLMMFLPRLLRRLPYLAPNDSTTDFVLRIQTPMFNMTSIVLAFTLVQADANFRHVDTLVGTEAAHINQLDRLLTRYGDAQANEVRPLLLTYARSIVNDEWPAMLHDHDNAGTGRAFGPVSRRILAIDPAPGRQSLIFAEMLKVLDSVAEARATRLNTLSLGLPAIYWLVVLFAAVILTLVNSTIEQTPFRTAALASIMAVLGALIGLVFLTDQPFKGDTKIGPHALVRVIAIMEARRE